MIVNDAHRFVFVHIPKVAGTSIRRALRSVDGINRRPTRDAGTWHETPIEMFTRLAVGPDDMMPSRSTASGPISEYAFFCFVRNPWARFCSLHGYLLRKGEQITSDVNDFAGQLAKRDPWLMGLRSIKPQSLYVVPPVKQIGRYETLHEDFSRITRSLNLELKLDHLNESGSHLEDYRQFLSPKAAGIIADFYNDDIKAFGYEF